MNVLELKKAMYTKLREAFYKDNKEVPQNGHHGNCYGCS